VAIEGKTLRKTVLRQQCMKNAMRNVNCPGSERDDGEELGRIELIRNTKSRRKEDTWCSLRLTRTLSAGL